MWTGQAEAANERISSSSLSVPFRSWFLRFGFVRFHHNFFSSFLFFSLLLLSLSSSSSMVYLLVVFHSTWRRTYSRRAKRTHGFVRAIRVYGLCVCVCLPLRFTCICVDLPNTRVTSTTHILPDCVCNDWNHTEWDKDTAKRGQEKFVEE